MALIECPECDGMVSDKASTCPHCGCPASEFKKLTPGKLPTNQKADNSLENKDVAQKDEEVWKEIPGFEGYFSVSNHGRVRSEDRTVPHARHGKVSYKGNIKKLTPSRRGREGKPLTLVVSLGKEHKNKSFNVHVLIAEAFLGERPDGLVIDHIDGDPTNNHVDNLEYVTYQENTQRAYDIGLAAGMTGESNPSSKLNRDDVKSIKQLLEDRSMPQAKIAKRYGVCAQVISDIKLGKTWKHVSLDSNN